MARLQPVSPEKLAGLLTTVRTSKHKRTLEEFNQSGDAAAFLGVEGDGKVTGLQSGLGGARRQMLKKDPNSFAKNIQVKAVEADHGVYLIRTDIVEAARSAGSAPEAAPVGEPAGVGV